MGQDGITVKKVKDEEEKGMISNKRPLKANLSKRTMEYGCFVKVSAADSSHRNFCKMVMVVDVELDNGSLWLDYVIREYVVSCHC